MEGVEERKAGLDPITLAQRDALVALAFSLAPGVPAVIAGGFAADYSKANDVDLWMLGDHLLLRTMAEFKRRGVRSHQVDPSVTSSVPEEVRTRAVCIVQTPILNIHVIGAPEVDVHSLLRTFDISTHRWGITEGGTTIPGFKSTFPYVDGEVLVCPYPTSTTKRIARLEARYGITIKPLATKKEAA